MERKPTWARHISQMNATDQLFRNKRELGAMTNGTSQAPSANAAISQQGQRQPDPWRGQNP